MKCKKCGKILMTADYGYYCDNQNCLLYDKIIFAYEEKERDKMEQRNCKTKGQAIQIAMEWQEWASGESLSYKELAEWSAYFETLAKKFDLTAEFKENGII